MKVNSITIVLFLFCHLTCSICLSGQTNCSTAATIFPLTLQCGTSQGNMGEFPADGSAPMNTCGVNYNDDEYWFQITGNGTQGIRINITSISNSYVGVFLYEGCPSSGGTCISSDVNTISTANLNITTATTLKSGVVYYVVVANWGAPNYTNFCLDATLIVPPTPPANNDCTSAIVLTIQPDNCTTFTAGSNVNATNSNEGTPSCGDFQGGDVWYSITTTSTSDVNFDVSNVQWPFANASLYSGSCGGGLTEIACTQFSTGWPFAFLGLTAGTYYLRVWDYSNNQTGTFQVCAFSPPANQVPTSKCGMFSSTPNAIINDSNDPQDNLVVSGTGQLIGDLNVAMRIDHTFLADLEIALTSPEGTTVNIMFDKCLSNDDLNVEFDDEGSPLICGTPTIGNYIPPSGTLSSFDGEVFDGTWTISVVDDSNGDHGELVQWCLIPKYLVPCNMVAYASTINVSCNNTNDGTATLIGSLGTEPYSYQWDAAAGHQTEATATGLAAGFYQATVADNELCSVVIGVQIVNTPCNPCSDASLDICAILTANPADPSGALDCDGDGVVNVKECSDMTDPRDACLFSSGSISLPVTADQSGCLNLCADLTPISTILPGNITGVSTVCAAVEVSEINFIDTDGTVPIIVRIPLDPRYPILFNPNGSPCALTPHNNSDWNYTSSAFTHNFTYVGSPILAGETKAFAFEGSYDPSGTSGQTTITASVVPGNGGGECNILNNTDSERLVYFN